MESLSYQLRDGFQIKGDIAAIAARIEELKRANASPEYPEGRITPEEVVADARDPESPLHGCFTWDMAKAAAKQLVHEARYLIRCYEVQIVRGDDAPMIVCPANVRIVPKNESSRYVSASFASQREDLRAQVVAEMTSQLEGMQKRLRSFEGISPSIIEALEQVKQQLNSARPKRKPRRKAG